MEINDIVKEYNEQRNRNCKTLEAIIGDIVEDTLTTLDNDLYDLVHDVRSGNYSLREIADRLEEIREKII